MGHTRRTSRKTRSALVISDAKMFETFRHPALDGLNVEEAAGPWGCAECPLNQWGSGNGRGKACKDLRRLIVLVEGWSMPAIMTLPPTSVKAFDTYASAQARTRGNAYFTT